MRVAPRPLRHWLAAPLFVSLLALALTADATTAHTYSPPFMQGGFAQLDVFERADGVALPVYGKDGQRFVVGTPGQEYALRIRNTAGERILVVTSVDGVNVISSETAVSAQSGMCCSRGGVLKSPDGAKALTVQPRSTSLRTKIPMPRAPDGHTPSA